MLKIGDFSRLSRVSVRMLRYYDDNDLVKPVKVDEYTGYRYYSEQQLIVMGKINALKEMGLGVAAIREILKCDDNPKEMERFFMIQKALLTEEAKKIENQLGLLDAAMRGLRKEEKMKYDCVIKEMPEKYVASVRQILPKYEEEGRLWHILCSETDKLGMVVCGPAMAVLHDKEYKEENVDVEVQLEVKGNYQDTENVRFKVTGKAQVVSTTFKGSYSQFPDVYAQMAAWVSENGYEFCGNMIDIYHVSPNETRNPDEFVTEICCAVKKL